MFSANLEGTSSKIQNVSLSEIKVWLSLVAPSAISLVDWEKVEGIAENKQISFTMSPHKLIIQHLAEPEKLNREEDPGFNSNATVGGNLYQNLKAAQSE